MIASNPSNLQVTQNITVDVTALISAPCDVGTSSANGFNYPTPCEFCQLGTYSQSRQAVSCTSCPDNFPRTLAVGAISSSQCTKCPLGYYCPIGSPPVLCPADGGYEPIGSDQDDRRSSGCVVVPCAPGYWCGPGAAEGVTYIQNLQVSDVSIAVVLGLVKTIPLPVTNVLRDFGDIILNVTSSLPVWLKITPTSIALPPLTSASSVDVVMDSTQFANPSGPLFGTEIANTTVQFSWNRESEPTNVFYFNISFSFQLVTVIVTPNNFRYSISEFGDSLTPPIPTEMDVFNTMCNYSVNMIISPQACDGRPFPSWFSFLDSNPFALKFIEEQAGLPTAVKFDLDQTGLAAYQGNLTANGSSNVISAIPAALYETTCVKYTFAIIDTGITITREAEVAFRLLRLVSLVNLGNCVKND